MTRIGSWCRQHVEYNLEYVCDIILLVELLLQDISVDHDPLCRVSYGDEVIKIGSGLLVLTIYPTHGLYLLVVVGYVHEYTVVVSSEVDTGIANPSCGNQDLVLVALFR